MPLVYLKIRTVVQKQLTNIDSKKDIPHEFTMINTLNHYTKLCIKK